MLDRQGMTSSLLIDSIAKVVAERQQLKAHVELIDTIIAYFEKKDGLAPVRTTVKDHTRGNIYDEHSTSCRGIT